MSGSDTRIAVGAAIAAVAFVLAPAAGAEDAKSGGLRTPAGEARIVTEPAQVTKPAQKGPGAAAGRVEKPTVDGRSALDRSPRDAGAVERRAPAGMRWVVRPDGVLVAVPEQKSPTAAAMNNSSVSLECLCRLSKADHCTFAVDAGGDIAKCGGDGTDCKGGDGDTCFWVPGPSTRFGGKAGNVAQ